MDCKQSIENIIIIIIIIVVIIIIYYYYYYWLAPASPHVCNNHLPIDPKDHLTGWRMSISMECRDGKLHLQEFVINIFALHDHHCRELHYASNDVYINITFK